MKKLILSCSVFLTSTLIFAQENTLPETGNVGIGTTTPTTTLDVNGSVKIDSTLNVKDSMIVQKNAKIKKNLTVNEDVIFSGLLNETNLAEKDMLFLDSQGKIVRGSKVNAAELLAKQIYEPKECGTQLNPTWSNGTNIIFTSCPEVNVGINNPTPRVKLDVNGGGYMYRLALGIKDPLQLGNELLYLKTSANGANAKLFVIENQSQKLLQLNNSGLLKVREVLVDNETWADYVFEPSYKLMGIKDLGEYIYKNKHLPNVPDAKTIAQEGLNLGKMQQLSFEKIEELTIYIVQLQQQLDEQAKQIKELQDLLKK